MPRPPIGPIQLLINNVIVTFPCLIEHEGTTRNVTIYVTGMTLLRLLNFRLSPNQHLGPTQAPTPIDACVLC
jgi:hypothetical protein